MRRVLGRSVLALTRNASRVLDKLWSLAIQGAFARFGSRSVLARPCRLEGAEHVHIGSGVWLGPGSWIQCIAAGETPPQLHIGDRVHASGSLVLSTAHEIVVEDDVLFARNVYVSDHIHGYQDTTRPVHEQGVDKVAAVRIERGAWLGQNVVVCPGVTIGRGAVIGAGSLVNSDIPPFSVAVGSPARVVKTFAAKRESERESDSPATETACVT